MKQTVANSTLLFHLTVKGEAAKDRLESIADLPRPEADSNERLHLQAVRNRSESNFGSSEPRSRERLTVILSETARFQADRC